MPSPEGATYSPAIWDIATPAQPHRLPGIAMAGFRARRPDRVDLTVVPFPAVTLVLDLSDDPVTVCDSTGRTVRGSLVAGLMPQGLRTIGRESDVIQVRLSPVVARGVLGDGADIAGSIVALDDLWGGSGARLTERLRTVPSWEARFALIGDALQRRLEDGSPIHPEIAHAWQQMETTEGQARVDDLAGEVGWSRQRLWSRFRSQVGLSPKRAAQLVRFDRAVHRLAAGRPAATVAAETGYVDQSHLNRDIKAFTGVTPTAVASADWLAVDDRAWPGSMG